MPNTNAITWFKKNFAARIQAAVEGTPFTVDLLTAIACQETGYIWNRLRKETLTIEQILALCVGDSLGGESGRTAFPRTRKELEGIASGAEIFAIAREALVQIAKYLPDYAGAAQKPDKFCHGFGIFQYDIQFCEKNDPPAYDPAYFLEKKWADFDQCVAKAVFELRSALKQTPFRDQTTLSDLEQAFVAIAYNAGSFKPAKGLKQGYYNKDDDEYYGQAVYRYLMLAKSVEVPANETSSDTGTGAAAAGPGGAAISLGETAASTLQEVEEKGYAIPLTDLGLPEHKALATEVQERLIALGFLEPPADGRFGPISRHALEDFQKQLGWPDEDLTIDRPLAVELRQSRDDRFFPVTTVDGDLASRIYRYMVANQLWFSRVPGHVNIVYLEGANADGSANANTPNVFNDRRLVLTIEGGQPKILGNWEATTEPGKYWTEHPMNPRGAARIAFGQYKAWAVGFHHYNNPELRHEALVQVGTIRVYRDLNEDYLRTGDWVDEGDSFAVNQHWGYDNPHDNLGRSSAGCLVGRTKAEHRTFMSLVKGDARYEGNHAYRFMTTVIDGSAFATGAE